MIYIKKWTDYYEDFFPIEPNQLEFFTEMGNTFPGPAKFLGVECGPALLTEHLQEKFDITLTDSYAEFVNIVNTRQSSKENPAHVFNLNPADIARYLGKNFFNVITCLCYRIIFMILRCFFQRAVTLFLIF